MIKKFYNKYIGYGFTIAFLISTFFWEDGKTYLFPIIFIWYVIGMIHSLNEKIQYVEGARPYLIHFSTVNDRLNDLPEFLTPLFYIGLYTLFFFLDSSFLGPFGLYYLISLAMISLWSSFYGKLSSAYLLLNKEEQMISCHDGVETYTIRKGDIQKVSLSKKKIIIEIPTKKINLIHLSLDEKEMRLVLDYFRSQLHITPIVLPEEEVIAS